MISSHQSLLIKCSSLFLPQTNPPCGCLSVCVGESESERERERELRDVSMFLQSGKDTVTDTREREMGPGSFLFVCFDKTFSRLRHDPRSRKWIASHGQWRR